MATDPPRGTYIQVSFTMAGKTGAERSAQLATLLLTLQMANPGMSHVAVVTPTETMTGQEALDKWKTAIKKAAEAL